MYFLSLSAGWVIPLALPSRRARQNSYPSHPLAMFVRWMILAFHCCAGFTAKVQYARRPVRERSGQLLRPGLVPDHLGADRCRSVLRLRQWPGQECGAEGYCGLQVRNRTDTGAEGSCTVAGRVPPLPRIRFGVWVRVGLGEKKRVWCRRLL